MLGLQVRGRGLVNKGKEAFSEVEMKISVWVFIYVRTVHLARTPEMV